MRALFILACAFAILLLNSSVLAQSSGTGMRDVQAVIDRNMKFRVTPENPVTDNGMEGLWYTTNDDSAFFKSDTVWFYNHVNSMYDSTHHCYFRIWDFAAAKSFQVRGINLCNEPPLTTIDAAFAISMTTRVITQEKPIAPNRYKLIQRRGNCYLILHNGNTEFDRFKVIGLRGYNTELWGINSMEWTLVRIKESL